MDEVDFAKGGEGLADKWDVFVGYDLHKDQN
jgi:hypothetical protein